MAKAKAVYFAFSPETWQALLDLSQCKEKETLSENAEAVFETQTVLARLRPLAHKAGNDPVWHDLLEALEGKNLAASGALPGWLLKLYAPERFAIGLTGAAQLAHLSQALGSSDESLKKPHGWPEDLRFYALLEFMHACARHGRILLALESSP